MRVALPLIGCASNAPYYPKISLLTVTSGKLCDSEIYVASLLRKSEQTNALHFRFSNFRVRLSPVYLDNAGGIQINIRIEPLD